MKVIGITGGAAAGKSELARIFVARGHPVIDADRIAHELLAPSGAAYAAVTAEFGTADRLALRQKIFEEPEARRKLEGILHPLIQAESRRRIAQHRDAGRVVAFYEAALLVETGRHRELDGLIVIHAPREARISRLMARKGITRVEAETILDAQLDDNTRERAADWVLDNSGDRAQLERQADDWLAANFPRTN